MWEKIAEWIVEHLPYEAIGRFVKGILLRRWLMAGLLLVFLASASILLWWYYKRSQVYGDIVDATLEARLEPTPQTFKGLESFLLSKVDGRVRTQLEDSILQDEFLKQYSTLTTTTKTSQPTDHDFAGFAGSLRLAGGISGGRVLTDSDVPGFLFLPADIIRGGYSTTGTADSSFITSAKTLIADDSELKRDILLSRAAASDVKALLGKHFFKPADPAIPLNDLPAQVYLITATGINRIFNNTIPDPANADFYYGTQFSATTYFPGRPYFQGALEKAQALKPLVNEEKLPSENIVAGPQTVGNYFYVSQPYMDLGGNGIVVTASRLLRTHTTCAAVLCLDFRFVETKSLSNTLLATINKFHAPRVRVKFTVNTESHYVGDPQVIEPAHDSLDDVQRELIEHGRQFVQDQSAADLSSFFGNIQVISQSSAQKDANKSTDANKSADENKSPAQLLESSAPLQISIPVGNIGSNKAEKFGEFLLFQLDLAGYRHTTDLIGFFGYTCLGLFSIMLVSGFVLTAERNDDLVYANEELHQAFEEIGAVMWEAPVPYTQLDSQDSIRNCNRALGDLLGHDHSDLISKKFRDLIHDDDKQKYDEVQEKRRNNEQVEPYALRFLKKGGGEVVAWIVSAPVPSVAGGVLGALPETFGIFLKSKPSDHKVIPMPPKGSMQKAR